MLDKQHQYLVTPAHPAHLEKENAEFKIKSPDFGNMPLKNTVTCQILTQH